MGILANLAAKGNTKLANSLTKKIKEDTLTTIEGLTQQLGSNGGMPIDGTLSTAPDNINNKRSVLDSMRKQQEYRDKGLDPKQPYLPDGSPNFQYQPMSMSEKSVSQPGNVMASTSVNKNVATPQSHLDAFAQNDANQAAGTGGIQTPQSHLNAFAQSDTQQGGSATPQSHLDAFAQYDAKQGGQGQGQQTSQPSQTSTTIQQQQQALNAPIAPTFNPIITQAPSQIEMPKVSSRQERAIRKSVREENKQIFDILDNIEVLAGQNRTAEIELAQKQAQELLTMFDEQMAKFEELKLNKDLTANEFAELERQREEINKDRLLTQNAIDRADTAAKYKDTEAQRVQYNENQRVRLETFAGLKNGFGSSAQVTNLENVMNDGQRALESIQKEAISYDAKYANEAMNIDKDYNLAIGNINANLNSTLRQNYNDLESAIMAINQNKLTTLQQKDSLILQAQKDYNNKVTENQLRIVDTIKQQNAEVQARISQLKNEQLTEYQIKTNEKWQITNFNLDKEKMGIEVAQNNYDNQLKLYTTVSNIMAQDASNDLELKKFQENIKQFDKEQERLNKELDVNTKQFGEKIALEKYIAETDAANKAKQATLDDYIQKEKLKIDQKTSVLDEKQIISSIESELRKKYTEIKDSAGNTIGFYDPIKNDFKTNSQINKEAIVNKDYLYFNNAVPIGLSTNDEKSVKENMYSYYNIGEIGSAKKVLENAYIKSSTNPRIPVAASLSSILENLKSQFKDFYNNGGTTDLLTGSEEKFNEFFGKTNNPKLAQLATTVRANLGNYTSTLSGGQFTDNEKKEYRDVLPSTTNTKELNFAKLDGALNAWNKTIKSDIKSRMPETSYKAIYGDSQLSDGSNVDDLFND